MKVNGIIAEYNPFHNGHKYQLDESLKLTGADYTVVVMSGNFVQRGDPALIDKHTRARMALLGGADLVLEIPSLYATSSAEYFANGSVSLLTKLGVVTHLCFGSECGDVSVLKRIAEILVDEPPEYAATLKRFMKQGMTYPNARTWALMQHYPDMAENKDVFSSPNNILGISYLKSILRQKSALEPVTIKRVGADYHARYLSAPLCSSLAIRQALCLDKSTEFLKEQMPSFACDLLSEQLASGSAAHSNDFSAALYYKLLSEREFGYEKYLDVSPDLSDRIQNRLNEFKDCESFCDLLKTKEMTYTRISRCLLHIFLNITGEDMQTAAQLGYTPYARVLGFRKSAAPLMSAIKEKSSIPLVTKLADAEKQLSEEAFLMLKKDITTSQLYYGVLSGKTTQPTPNEYTIPLVIV
jgi:predicted nucleotidyltransferase